MKVLRHPGLQIRNQKGAPALPCLALSPYFHNARSSTKDTEKSILETVRRKNLPCMWPSEDHVLLCISEVRCFFKRLAISEGRQSILNNRKKGLFGRHCSVFRQVVPQLSGVKGQLCLWMAHPRASGISCLCMEQTAAMRGRRCKYIHDYWSSSVWWGLYFKI